MPFSLRIKLLIEMDKRVQGVVGQWANEAKGFINQLKARAQHMSDSEFKHQLGQWDLLIAQAPACISEQWVRS